MNQCKNHSVYSFLKTNKQMEKQTKNHKTKTQQQKPKKPQITNKIKTLRKSLIETKLQVLHR